VTKITLPSPLSRDEIHPEQAGTAFHNMKAPFHHLQVVTPSPGDAVWSVDFPENNLKNISAGASPHPSCGAHSTPQSP